ncbi:metal ABC transporter ATP-binding protein [Salmonella enterica]|nr:metal ABC transporter ATP-binding protein [Salmonella enterica]EBY9434252.1 metal ABC transporter ATP-binding protein [Salmonella enterica subsp. enterica serovar Cerro]EGQ2011199.1 metal ABC transporter ATP-binding protein [Salmonella enterica subsp. enterica serovar Infantis]EIE5051694.1 metal ABC transporter ATP-binding protein [Salmonella enterica subsp. enterica serovar Java]EBR6512390.1 metal ABC transporter ATP-binding protein [Salmonella enterica]
MLTTNNSGKNNVYPAVSVEALTVSYRGGNIGLSDVSFELKKPTICGLIGMNGAGKSTLFRAIMGFVSPACGKVEVCHQPVKWAQKQNIIAYVPQTEEVDWTFPVSVRDVVMMGRQGRMGFLRIPSERDSDIVMESLIRVGMESFVNRQIGELSGGQRKRVFLARALAQQSLIMLLDEPFTGVDVQTEHAIIAILRELREEGSIIIVSTHNLASVPGFCDEVMMVNSTLIAFGPVSEVYSPDNLGKTFGGTIHQLPVGVATPAPQYCDGSSGEESISA